MYSLYYVGFGYDSSWSSSGSTAAFDFLVEAAVLTFLVVVSALTFLVDSSVLLSLVSKDFDFF